MCPQNSRYILHMAKYQCLQKKMKEAKTTMEALDIKEGIPIAQILYYFLCCISIPSESLK
jgi:hypothetical protein